MPRAIEVKITKGKEVGYCLPESVAAWERNGWTAKDDGSEQDQSLDPKSEPEKKTTPRKAP